MPRRFLTGGAISVTVQWYKFILGLNFIFLLFLSKVVYDNEFETTENEI